MNLDEQTVNDHITKKDKAIEDALHLSYQEDVSSTDTELEFVRGECYVFNISVNGKQTWPTEYVFTGQGTEDEDTGVKKGLFRRTTPGCETNTISLTKEDAIALMPVSWGAKKDRW